MELSGEQWLQDKFQTKGIRVGQGRYVEAMSIPPIIGGCGAAEYAYNRKGHVGLC